jgi:hypothetical protein
VGRNGKKQRTDEHSNFEPIKAEVRIGVSDRLRLSICFFFFSQRTTTDAKPQAEQQELPLHFCLLLFDIRMFYGLLFLCFCCFFAVTAYGPRPTAHELSP